METKDVIIRPIITEKATGQIGRQNQYSFKVSLRATKKEIKRAIEEFFGVKVKAVNTVIIKGKTRKIAQRGRKVYLTDWKKAVVELKAGEKIALFETEAK